MRSLYFCILTPNFRGRTKCLNAENPNTLSRMLGLFENSQVC